MLGAAALAPGSVGAQDTTGVGAITGKISRQDGAPAADIAVCVVETSQCAVSAADGTFRIGDVRAGAYRLEITPAGGTPIQSDPVTVRAGLEGRVEVTLPTLEGLTQTVTVTAPAFVPSEEIKNSSYLIRQEEILTNAAALQDVSRYVQTLPGVVPGTNDFRNDIIVRGGSPLENLFVVDNIEIPNINTFANFASAGGTVSILDANLIQDVTFLTGGYPAPYINRASSVLQVTQREGSRDDIGGRATFGFAGAGGIVEGPIGREKKGSWIVSARRSILDLFSDDVGFGGVPTLYTINAKATYDLSPKDRIWLINVTGFDNIRLGRTDDAEDIADEINTFDIRYEGQRSSTGVNWQRLLGDRTVGLLGVTFSAARVDQQVKDLAFGGVVAPPDVPAEELIATSPVVFSENSGEDETTLKYDLTTELGRAFKLQVGGSFKAFRIDYDTASPYGNDSPYVQEPGFAPFNLTRKFTSTQAGAYVQATQDLSRRLNVTYGARVDYYDYLSSTKISPRAGASYAFNEAWSWRGSYGRYYQQPFFLFLAAFEQNRLLVPFEADHFVTGVSYTGAGRMRATAEVYHKQYRNYPVAADIPQLSLANIGDTFATRDILFPLLSDGKGEVTGVEFLAERKPGGRWYGQASVAISRARHAGLDQVLRPGSFDYPVVVNLTGSWLFADRWQASARAVYLSGRPYTPFDVVTSTQQNRGVYDLAQVNGLRADDYFRLDARVDRSFIIGGQRVTFFAGAQNLTNRKNFATLGWNRTNNMAEINTQNGIFPLIGFDWPF
ncbi:collagen-binding protein [Luteitalea sp. TBR-22]|uniref:TonB-dependent receptor n=1 Tax=Luteitalea sp. TBR-22 TaxID=2802971 RepID=UPI001AF23526|nr:TonB-dependent receptor [Luteitalea sp. TBR-22]BCS31985.1 collagen-binding protein [Luteitalea sp. TBR-22]